MPSFLSKVFGRKKDDNHSPRGRSSNGSLLDGKFEAVSPAGSPSVPDFPENARAPGGQGKGKAKESGFGLFKIKSRPSSPDRLQSKDNLPQLSLLLPLPKEDTQLNPLSISFELDPDARGLTDTVTDNKRLNPSEALTLIRTCSQAISARGLDTLGLMHPHWHSASPETQRRLISLFVHSLTTNASAGTSSSAPSLSTSAFESEVNYTRSPHDIAAVLRWGLRHFELDGNSFGKEDSWYTNFLNTEKSSDYPPEAYFQSLLPLVPSSHFQLLDTLLDLFSTLAAHAEKNGTSGSKLTRTFGFWLFAVPRVVESDNWSSFYARWVRAGRMLEHLFLARIRDQSLSVRLPTRLLELVAQYPYHKGATIEDDEFLVPRLSTTQHDALFVRIETETSSKENPKWHPLRLVKHAFDTEITAEKSEYVELWEIIRNAGLDGSRSPAEGYPALSRVFADETIRYLELIPGDHSCKEASSPTVHKTGDPTEAPTPRQRPSSPEEKTKAMNGSSIASPKPTIPLPSSSASPLEPDWMQFSTSGFSTTSPAIIPLASTLFGHDMEKTNPPARQTGKLTKPSGGNIPRKSMETPSTAAGEVANPKPEEPQKFISRSTLASMVQIDGAFIDFWTDGLLDPISSDWPTFVICKLNSSVSGQTIGNKHIDWLVIEHVFVPEPQPNVPENEAVDPAAQERTRPSSPRSSIISEKLFFSFFTNSSRRNSSALTDKATTSKGLKKFSPDSRVNELGEVLKEEEEKPTPTVKLRIPSPKPRKSVDAPRRSVDVARKSMEGSRKPADIAKEPSQKENKLVEPKEVEEETSVQIPKVVDPSFIAEPRTTEAKDESNGIAAPEPESLADHIAAQEPAGIETSHEGVTSLVFPPAVPAADIVSTPSDTFVPEQRATGATISTQNGDLSNEVIERSIHSDGEDASKPVTIPLEQDPISETHPSTASAPHTSMELENPRASDAVDAEQDTAVQVSLPLSENTAQEDIRTSISPADGTAVQSTMAEENEAEPNAINTPAVEVPVATTTAVDAPVFESASVGTTANEEHGPVVDTSETAPENSNLEEPIERVDEASTITPEDVDQQAALTASTEQKAISEDTAAESLKEHPTAHTSLAEDNKDTVGQSSDTGTTHVTSSSTADSTSAQDASKPELLPDIQHTKGPIESATESSAMPGLLSNGEATSAGKRLDETAPEETPSTLQEETAHISSEPLIYQNETTENAAEGQGAYNTSSAIAPSESNEQDSQEKQGPTQSESIP